MKKAFLCILLCSLLFISCGESFASPTLELVPTRAATSTITPTITPSPTATSSATATPYYIPPEIEVEFGPEISQNQKAQVLTAVGKWVAYFQLNGFGDPQTALLYADVDRQNLVDKSYAQFNIIAPQSYDEWAANTWSRGQGGMSMIVEQKGYIFFNLSHPYWNRPIFSGGQPTLGDCGIGSEMLHLYHQWLSGINHVDVFGTNPRSSRENGPNWLFLGKEGVLCADAYGVSIDINRNKILEDLKLVPSELLLQDLIQASPDASDELGYLQQAGVFYLLTESPGGKSLGAAKSLATFFHGLADESKTWEEAFAETWGWTVDKFYEDFEEHRRSRVPTPWPTTSISGQVLDSNGLPVVNIQVFACTVLNNGETQCISTRTLANGSFKLWVSDGSYDIRFSLTADPPSLFYSKSAPGQLTAGYNDGTLISVHGSDVTGINVQLP